MSVKACLPGLLADGQLTPEQAGEAGALFDELEQDLRRQFGSQAAAAMASDAVLAALESAALRKRFLAGLQIAKRQQIALDMGQYRGRRGGGGGPIDPAAGPALIDHDPRARFSNVEGRRKAILGDAHRLLDGVMADFSANLRGQTRNKAQLQDMVRELFGEASGNETARAMAASWRKAAEALRRRFNAAGGDIGFREDWGLPQSHDWRRVRAAGYEAWRADLLPRLDRAKMIDRRTGHGFSDAALELQLRETFEAIRTNGWSRRTPGSPAGMGALANRRAEGRFLAFKSAEDWAAYAERFGQGSAYDAMMGHVEGMARDIAALEVLGPNPDATLRWVKGALEESAARDTAPGSQAVQRARAAGKKIDEVWSEYQGANSEPRNERLALVFSGMRSWQVATKLGSAFLSGPGDFAFQASRRKFNGLPVVGMIRDYAKLMRPGSIEDQKLAVRRGLIAEEWSNRTAAQSRYLSEELTGEFPRRMAEGVLRLSLLSRHTQTARWVYGMEALATYTEQLGKGFAALEPKLAGTLERYGISAADWERIRAAPLETDRGVEWIAPHRWGDDDLASRFMEMIHEEVDIAVPVADLATRALINTKLERGTWLGEIGRSALLFKGFGVSVMVRQVQEMMAMSGTQATRYGLGLLAGTTVMGALAIQLKALAAGKDPRPGDDVPFRNEKTGELEMNPGFWGAAMLQGGGFGIFGDFMASAENRFGGGFAQTMAGPMADDLQGLANVAQSRNPAGAALREAKSQIPGNNIWYSRLALDRMLADQLQQAVDPDHARSWARAHKYAREQGTQFWWSPGDMAPDRAPDLGNAIEGNGQ